MNDQFEALIKKIVDLEDTYQQEEADRLRAKLNYLIGKENQVRKEDD